MQKIYDILIVGAGPVGLATAVGLYKRGIENIIVLDQTSSFRRVGQVIDLLPNGLKALKAIDFAAYEEVKKTANNFLMVILSNPTQSKTAPQWVYKNFQGETMRSISLDYNEWVNSYGEGRLSIPWYDLQTTLRNQLPSDIVLPLHRCINLVDDPENGCVRVDFSSNITKESNPYAHWLPTETENQEDILPESKTTTFRAKLVIGADGINSRVRQVIYSDTPYSIFAQPEYSGFAAISCREITVTDPLYSQLIEQFLQDSPIVTIASDEVAQKYRLIVSHRGGKLNYIIHLPLSREEEKSGTALIDLAVSELEKANFPSPLIELVRLSSPANMLQRFYYIHRASIGNDLDFPSTAKLNISDPNSNQPQLSRGKVLLVGDAAHGMPPFMAQGTNQGFEDAIAAVRAIANLARHNNLDNLQAIGLAFSEYEKIRRPIMVEIQQATLKQIYYVSHQEWQKYNQKVYQRDFEVC